MTWLKLKRRAIMIITVVALMSVPAIFQYSARAQDENNTGNVGGGGQSGLGSCPPGVDPTGPNTCFRCNESGGKSSKKKCPHYVRGTIEEFKQAWKNRSRQGKYDKDEYELCINKKENPTGEVVWVGTEYVYKEPNHNPKIYHSLRNQYGALYYRRKSISTFPKELPTGGGEHPRLVPQKKMEKIYHKKRKITPSIQQEVNWRKKHGTEYEFWDEMVDPEGKFGLKYLPMYRKKELVAVTDETTDLPKIKLTWFILMQHLMDKKDWGNDHEVAFFCPGLAKPTIPQPKPKDPPEDPPGDLCPDAINKNFGNTTGLVGVVNLSKSREVGKREWKQDTEIANNVNGETYTFARPGDNIKFKQQLCYGAQAVEHNGDYSFSQERNYGNKNKPNWFRISAFVDGVKNEKYLFGKTNSMVNGKTIYLEKGTPRPREVSDADVIKDYSFRTYSPSIGNKTYQCEDGAFGSNDFYKGGFQLPGFTQIKNHCTSAKEINDASTAGKKIAQVLEFNDLKSWIGLKSTNKNSEGNEGMCSCHSVNTRVHHTKVIESYEEAVANNKNSEYPLWGDRMNRCDPECDNCCTCHGCTKGRWPNTYYDSCCRKTGTKYIDSDENGKRNRPIRFNRKEDHTVRKEAAVYIPYNFKTEVSANIEPNEVVFGGQKVSSKIKYSILGKKNSLVSKDKYTTITPPNSKVQVIDFLLPADSDNITGNKDVAFGREANLCDYFNSRNGGTISCSKAKEIEGPFNPDGYYSGSGHYASANRTVPDVQVGMKYCVAVGIYPADSHNYLAPSDATNRGIAMKGGDRWNISHPSCRTIAKKPNYQVWNGGTFTRGSINTSVSKKIPGATLGNWDSKNARLFGSWDSYIVIAGKDIRGFASGGALGYNAGYQFDLPGGHSNTNKFKDLSILSIANNRPNTYNYTAGNSRIDLVHVTLNRLRDRYRNIKIENPSNDINNLTTLESGLEYVWVKEDANFGRVITKGLSGGKKDNTIVYYVDGNLTIDHNVCYTDNPWECSKDNNKLGDYSLTTDSIAKLPQILIFAKNIKITSNVSRIDAWLIAEENINTCDGFSLGSKDGASKCSKLLMINGPVYAGSLSLMRTGGAYPGGGGAVGDVLNRNLSLDGSITPAEIFNLRADTYFWATHQANRFSQAVVTFAREMAPRW